MNKADVFFIMSAVWFARGASVETAVTFGFICLVIGFVVLWRGD